MNVEIKIDRDCKEPRIIIITDKITEEINSLVDSLKEEQIDLLAAFKDDKVQVLDPNDIYRIFTQGGKVLAEARSGSYKLRFRIYELEKRLARENFIRISNSEIINLKKVKNFDLSFTGTICVSLTNGSTTYVSRRYVPKIKKVLGI